MGRVRALMAIVAVAWPLIALAQESTPVERPVTVFSPAQTVEADIARLSEILSDESARQEDRDEAARRLASRNTPVTRQILRDALVSASNSGAQLAAARALVGAGRPDEIFRDPLFALIGRSRQHSEAAAMALAGYKGDIEVVRRLTDVARTAPAENVRIAAIRALGMLVEKRAAAALVDLLTRPEESSAVHAAAADALVHLTGLRENGRSVPKWQQWWRANAGLDDVQWKLAMLDERSARYDRLLLRHDVLAEELQALMLEQYQQANDGRREAIVLRMLRSPSPAVRAAGANRVYSDMVQGLRVSPAVQAQVRALIGDSDREVRAAVAQALFSMVDSEAVDPLLVQLAQETDAEVKTEIVRTLAKIGEPRSIDALQRLLRDDSLRVAEAAADALREFGRTLRDREPARATQTALQLRELLEDGGPRAESPRFREAVVDAMAAMREPQLGQTFLRLVRPGESTGVRRAALRGMGALRDRKFADVIFEQAGDPDVGIRAEAAAALQFTASPEDLVRLLPWLDPRQEPSEAVRNAVWRAIEGLLPELKSDQLKNLADQFPNDPARRSTIQEKRRDLLIQERRPEELARARQDLGSTYMELGEPEKAATEFSGALEHWRTQGQEMMAESLVSQLLTAQLRAARYTDAAAFAASMISTRTGFQDIVGPMLRDEAERLVQAGDTRAALELIAAVEKMDPPLAPRFTAPLQAIKNRANGQTGG